MKQYLVIALLGFLLTPRANAQVASYLFDAPCTTTCNNPGPDCPGVGNANATSFNSSVIGTAGPFTVSPSLSLGTASCSSPVFSTSMNGFSAGNPANPSRARWASGWTTSVAASTIHYFTATLTAATYATVGITQITFDESRSATGPHMCQVMVSVDGGPFTLLWQGVIPDNTGWRSWSITSFTALAPMPTFSNTLTVRFQGFASEALTGSWRIDNVRFYAAIVNLPIELLSFTGEAQEQDVRLDWSTATETNNDYFTVYRLESDATWSEVGRVIGAGNSVSTREYSLLDPEPKVGLNYYLLRQTDIDGAFEDSPMISVIWKPPDKIMVFPNPPDRYEPVSITGEFTSVTVTNGVGQIVPSSVSGNEVRFPSEAGTYFLLIETPYGNRETITVVRH